VARDIGARAGSEDILNAFANARPFLDVTGDTVMAWMLLWRAVVARQKAVPGFNQNQKQLPYTSDLNGKIIF
jgi:hypothetical protein